MSNDTSAALLEGFFSCCPEMFFIARVDGALLTWSDMLGKAFGSALDQGSSLAALAHPDDRAAVTAAWRRLRQSSEPVLFRGRFADASGAHRALSCHARKLPGGDTIHGWLTADFADAPAEAAQHDIAESVARRAKERLLNGITDNLPVTMWALDAAGNFTFHDGKGLERAGLARGQFVGQNIHNLDPDQRLDDEITNGIRRAFAGEATHFITDAHELTWEMWLVPTPSATGEVESVLGFSLDVSDAKRAERELRARLELIETQQEVIRNLSTPIIEVWDGVLTLPMVGIVDSIRTAEVMDSLLRRIVDTQARFAILDLTGVEMVDTRVASHLVQLVSAIQLLGAEGIVAGIKPTVAQTMVALGLDLTQIVTQRNLRAGLSYCLKRMNPSRSPSSQSPAGKV